LPAIYLFPVMA